MPTIYLKLGGSLITDKTRPETPRPGRIRALARSVKKALADRPDIQLLLGHGSGSFGHVVGRKYGLREGIRDREGWWGYALTAAAAARLNRIVTDIFLEEGVPVVSLSPSASAWCDDGELDHMETRPIIHLLVHGLIPLVYGDVASDRVRGGTIISTEEIFAYLARAAPQLRPHRIVLLGEVDGVYTRDPHRDPHARPIPRLTAEEALALSGLEGSHGVDVTGGMVSKIRVMARLVQTTPDLTVHILSGTDPDRVRQALLHPERTGGTLIVPHPNDAGPTSG